MRPLVTILLLSLLLPVHAQTDPRVFSPYTPQPATPVPSVAPSTVQKAKPVNILEPSAVQQATPLTDSGHVVIQESARITALMKDYANTKQPLRGFRVQIFLGDRTKGEEIRRAFLSRHPELPAYLSYLAPNFRVRVGDLRNKREAFRLRDELKDEFPGLYVVPDDIELPRLIAPAQDKR